MVFSPTVQPVQSDLLLLLFLGGQSAAETEQRSHDGHQTPRSYRFIHIQSYISPRTSRPVLLITEVQLIKWTMAALHLGVPVLLLCTLAQWRTWRQKHTSALLSWLWIWFVTFTFNFRPTTFLPFQDKCFTPYKQWDLLVGVHVCFDRRTSDSWCSCRIWGVVYLQSSSVTEQWFSVLSGSVSAPSSLSKTKTFV